MFFGGTYENNFGNKLDRLFREKILLYPALIELNKTALTSF